MRDATVGAFASVPALLIPAVAMAAPRSRSITVKSRSTQSAWRQTLVDQQPFMYAVERLPVAGVDRHLARAVLGRIVEGSGLKDDGVEAGATRNELRAAIAAEFSGDCAFEIVAFELARLTLRVSKTVDRHQHEHVRRAAGKILARTTMTLRPQHRRSRRFVANLAAVAAASKRQWVSLMTPLVSSRS